MRFGVQVKMNGEWRWMAPSMPGTPPYSYPSEEGARSIMRASHPDQAMHQDEDVAGVRVRAFTEEQVKAWGLR